MKRYCRTCLPLLVMLAGCDPLTPEMRAQQELDMAQARAYTTCVQQMVDVAQPEVDEYNRQVAERGYAYDMPKLEQLRAARPQTPTCSELPGAATYAGNDAAFPTTYRAYFSSRPVFNSGQLNSLVYGGTGPGVIIQAD